jgi:hypothetical protein
MALSGSNPGVRAFLPWRFRYTTKLRKKQRYQCFEHIFALRMTQNSTSRNAFLISLKK